MDILLETGRSDNMQSSPVYLVDTNILIEASRRYYACDICPGYWTFMVNHMQSGAVQSIDKVRDEILRGTDWLRAFVKDLPSEYFVSSSRPEYGEIITHVSKWATERYSSAACNQFFDQTKADFWLVVTAIAGNHTLVTHEMPNPRAIKAIPLATACEEFGISYIQSHEMIRQLGGSFHELN